MVTQVATYYFAVENKGSPVIPTLCQPLGLDKQEESPSAVVGHPPGFLLRRNDNAALYRCRKKQGSNLGYHHGAIIERQKAVVLYKMAKGRSF
jgi:hypothetical protein